MVTIALLEAKIAGAIGATLNPHDLPERDGAGILGYEHTNRHAQPLRFCDRTDGVTDNKI